MIISRETNYTITISQEELDKLTKTIKNMVTACDQHLDSTNRDWLASTGAFDTAITFIHTARMAQEKDFE
jgi:hypothetical protein